MPSTTAKSGGVLGAFAGIFDWLKTRIANIDIFDEHYQLEAKTNPFYALGPIFYLVWFVVMATGCVLIIWYVPTKAEAFNSIFNIQNHIPLGGLIRGMHKYGADAMIIAATMRMYRMFLMGDYKPGKEFNVAIGLIALLLSMYSGLTGYLLIWNQRAFWATKVFATFPTYMDQFPVMGDFYQPLIRSIHMGWNTAEVLLGGGAAITQETITRFFSLHLAFSLIPLIFVELYFYKNAYARMPINWTKRLVVVAMLVIVAIILPAAQGRRSDPDVTPLPILSDWYFLGLYQMYKYLEPVVATEITIVIPLSVMLLPFLESAITGPEKEMMKRPLIFMVSVMAMLTWVIFSFLIIANIANIHNDPPYWRLSFYLLIDGGIIWQLALIWMNPNVQERIKAAKAAMIMGVIGIVQGVLAWIFFYMANTEIFMDPMWHQFIYMLMRWSFGNNAQQAEDSIRTAIGSMSQPLPYNEDFVPLLHRLFGVKGATYEQAINKLNDAAQQSSAFPPFDWICQMIPTFSDKHPHYLSAMDFMISNRWCYDFVNFTERLNPLSKVATPYKEMPYYPLPVPDLDQVWMYVLTPLTIVLAFGTYFWCKKAASAPKTAPAQPAVSAAS